MAKSRFLIWLEFGSLWPWLQLCRRVPLPFARLLGAAIGLVAWVVAGNNRRIALRNLEIALGQELPVKTRRQIVRRSFLEFGVTAGELLCFPGIANKEIANHTTPSGLEELRAAYAKGTGVIVCAPHYGNWEWVAAYGALQGFKVNAIYRPLDNPLLDGWLQRYRAEKGVKLLPRATSVRAALEALRQGELLALMMDQNAAVGGVFVPYFGTPASTMRGPSYFAAHSGAPVFFAYDEREGGGHRVHIHGPLRLTGGASADLCLLHELLEGVVRHRPELNFWMHPRWKKRPPGEASLYPGLRI